MRKNFKQKEIKKERERIFGKKIAIRVVPILKTSGYIKK